MGTQGGRVTAVAVPSVTTTKGAGGVRGPLLAARQAGSICPTIQDRPKSECAHSTVLTDTTLGGPALTAPMAGQAVPGTLVLITRRTNGAPRLGTDPDGVRDLAGFQIGR